MPLSLTRLGAALKVCIFYLKLGKMIVVQICVLLMQIWYCFYLCVHLVVFISFADTMTMKNTTAILQKLRALMKNAAFASPPINAYIIPSGDAHLVRERVVRFLF